jgi:hypothetical protein
MLKPICVACQRFYRPHHTGKQFVEAMPAPGHARAVPGSARPDQWQPYKLWRGDEWMCHGCGSLIIVGTGHGPTRERHEPAFDDERRNIIPYFQVNDC